VGCPELRVFGCGHDLKIGEPVVEGVVIKVVHYHIIRAKHQPTVQVDDSGDTVFRLFAANVLIVTGLAYVPFPPGYGV